MQTTKNPGEIVEVKLRIDPHVHCRDEEQSYKATIGSVTKVANDQGVKIIFDMPNPKRPVVSIERVKQRLELADKQGCLDGYYVWGGITKESAQIEEIALAHAEFDRVIGLKMFAGKSVGNLTVSHINDQLLVYRTLASLDYRGVVGVHAEKELYFMMDLWNPKDPKTWNDARPPMAEAMSVRDQIFLAKEAGFRGHLHICHVSTPEAVDIIMEERGKDGLQITCGVTPSHVLLSTNDMNGEQGLRYKVNPPLRSEGRRARMWQHLKDGNIDWIETDHAPHTEEEKLRRTSNEEHMSGIQGLLFYTTVIDKLRREGVPEGRIDNLTCNNILRVFPKVRK